jgi:uncharacterized membrane protein
MLINRKFELLTALKGMKKYALIIGPGSIGTYLIILFVFQITQVSYVVTARESSVLFGALLGIIFLKEQYSAQKMFSIVCIIIGMCLIKIA